MDNIKNIFLKISLLFFSPVLMPMHCSILYSKKYTIHVRVVDLGAISGVR
jgi:hypothetical protein